MNYIVFDNSLTHKMGGYMKKYIPNILSSMRLLSPFVLTPLIVTKHFLWAIIALVFFLLTDSIDGYLARKWNVISDLGSKLDVVADKIILLSLLIPLIIDNKLLIVTLVLEGLISLVNVTRKLTKGHPKTSQIGRIKMIIVSIFMGLNYLNMVVNVPKIIIMIMFSITLLFQLVTLINYIRDFIKEKNNSSV